ncbi:alpha/beta fold hydrolase [Saccharopolyspora cebuensis]|uniref:alpha/beta fold hydrolase n=1 Tax=Saccharopolyspora cebuensis TaxID=418759 RepID=UPI0031F0D9B9
MRARTIETNGGQLYAEFRGEHGPVVLIVQGGLSEAGATEQLADDLAQDHQVITYDRRGLSRSSGPAGADAMATHADDAAALLTEMTDERANVIGPSIGAVIGLHLAVRHPGKVGVLIAHEPPMPSLVRDPEREAGLDQVAELADGGDLGAAIRTFATLGGPSVDSREDGARPAPTVGDGQANLKAFFRNDFPAVRRSDLRAKQITALPATTAVVPTGGRDSRSRWEWRCAQQLARELGRELTELPGGHNGLVSHPWASATTLRRLIAEADDGD